MVGADAMQIRPISPDFAGSLPICYISARMATTSGTPEIHSEARGPHWIAWVTEGAGTKPVGSVVLVAANQAEAEARARQWAESRAS